MKITVIHGEGMAAYVVALAALAVTAYIASRTRS
jgi:hypothetical protein